MPELFIKRIKIRKPKKSIITKKIMLTRGNHSLKLPTTKEEDYNVINQEVPIKNPTYNPVMNKILEITKENKQDMKKMITHDKIRKIIRAKVDSNWSSIEETILTNYMKEIDAKTLHNRIEKVELAATLYYMVRRKAKQPITFKEAAETFDDEATHYYLEKRIRKLYRYIYKKLDIKQCGNHSMVNTTCLMQIKPSQVIPQLIEKMDIKEEFKQEMIEKSLHYGKMAWKKYKGGRNIYGFSAAVIYITALINGQRITQRDAADSSSLTEVTIRSQIRVLWDLLSEYDEFVNDCRKHKNLIMKSLKSAHNSTLYDKLKDLE